MWSGQPEPRDISGFRTELTNNQQLWDAYHHIQGVAGITIADVNGLEKAGGTLFAVVDKAQGLFRDEDETAYRDDRAGMSVGELVNRSIASGDFSALSGRVASILCNPSR